MNPDARRVAGLALAAGLLLAALLYLLLGVQFRFDGYGEGLYDLHYMAGGWLGQGWPVPELWNPGETVRHYYNLGLSGWGWLLGRLGLSLGSSYVLALILLPALVFAAYTAAMGGPAPLRMTAAFVATFPATGISLFVGTGLVPLPDHLRTMGHVRLTEWADRDPGGWLTGQLISGEAYPVESLAHLVLDLQDVHPPVLGYVLLAGLLLWAFGPRLRRAPGAAAASTEAPGEIVPNHHRLAGWAQGLLPGLLLPLAYAVNAWMLPFMLGASVGLLALRRVWPAYLGLLAGAALGVALLWWPFLRHFDAPGAVSLTLLEGQYRSAPLSWLLIWGPCLLASLWWSIGQWRWGAGPRGWLGLAPWLFALAVLSLEVIHLDDAYSGTHERFNSVLKTGSLALAAWTASLLILATRSRDLRLWLPVLLLLAAPALAQLKDLGAKLGGGAGAAPNWALDGATMIAEEDMRALYQGLQALPPGVTLEFTDRGAYTIVPVASTLAAYPTWGGWISHLDQIGAVAPQRRALRDELQSWYRVFPPDNAVLDRGGVEYILVSTALNWHPAQIGERVGHLGPAWQWQPLWRSPQGAYAGIFRRREPGS